MRRRFRAAAAWISALAAAGCTTLPDNITGRCGKRPIIHVGSEQSYTDVSVLTYNIEGLPWPGRRDRAPLLKEIGRQLARERAAGTGADIVLIQEAFSPAAVRSILSAGYANRVGGPSPTSLRMRASSDAPASLTQRRKLTKGERFGTLLPSGLFILSDYPVLAHQHQPFRRGECAGYDCLANKGVVWAQVAIPGVPSPVDIFNTHLQSRAASGVSRNRSFQAHRLQVSDVGRFIEARRAAHNPLIFGGDFNMRNSPRRFEHFDLVKPWPLVHRHCTDHPRDCIVLASWDGDAPWMDTQDLQGFDSGALVSVRPVKVETKFDRPWNGTRLADHDGLLVTYRLTWPNSARAAATAACL